MSVIALTYLNMMGLPDQIEGFFGDNPSEAQTVLADNIAYVLIVLVIALLVWTIVEMYRGNKRVAKIESERKSQIDESEK